MTKIIEDWDGSEVDSLWRGSIVIYCKTAPPSPRSALIRGMLDETPRPVTGFQQPGYVPVTTVSAAGRYDFPGNGRISLDGSGGTYTLILA